MILCYIEIFFLHYTGPTGAAAARPPPRVPAGARARHGGRAQARGGRQARGGGQVRGAAVLLHETYDVREPGNPPLPFQPTRPIGVHFGQRLLRNAMTTAVEFFNLFFTVEFINDVVTHTNSYAYEHIETQPSYAKSDGSWQEATADEIRRLVAILIYFGLIRVSDTADNYWSVRSLYLCL